MFRLFGKKRYNVLVVGGNGMLGHDVVEVLMDEARRRNGIIDYVDAPLRSTLDAAYDFNIRDYMEGGHKFDFIINCAASTDTVGCERWDMRRNAYMDNVETAASCARICKETGAKLIHISTNEVFEDSILYRMPQMRCRPASVYGMQKYIAECEIEKILPERQYIILRTSWLFGHHGGKSFVHKCAKNFAGHLFSKRHGIKDGKYSKLYGLEDEIASPNSTKFLSHFILGCMRHNRRGIIHAVQSSRGVSRYEFMREVLKAFNYYGRFLEICLDDIANETYIEHPELRKVGCLMLEGGTFNAVDYPGCNNTWKEDLYEMLRWHVEDIVAAAEDAVEAEMEKEKNMKRGSDAEA